MTEDTLGAFVVRTSDIRSPCHFLPSSSSLTIVHGAQNWLGLLIVALVLAYHFVVADPKFAQE